MLGKCINVLSSRPNATTDGQLNGAPLACFFLSMPYSQRLDASQVRQCILGLAQFGGSRAANDLANIQPSPTLSTPRCHARASMSLVSPNAAETGPLNDLSASPLEPSNASRSRAARWQ
ncbi:hypothetical protein FB107DRAFT_269274 [Schizophyllum commune]